MLLNAVSDRVAGQLPRLAKAGAAVLGVAVEGAAVAPAVVVLLDELVAGVLVGEVEADVEGDGEDPEHAPSAAADMATRKTNRCRRRSCCLTEQP